MNYVPGTTLFLAAALLFATAASAADPPPRPQAFDKLLDCRAIAENAARLACYDGQAEQLSAAATKGEIAVISKQDIRETRRSLFGFVLPRFSIRGLRDDQPDIDRIEATVLAIRPAGYFWTIALDQDAGTWQTTEPIARDPRKGDKVLIKKGVMGGYMGKFGGSALVRMKRVS